MSTLNLLYKDRYDINESISVCIPTVEQILEDEDTYNNMVFLLTASPIDMLVQLDEAGIDFTTISDFDLFLMIFEELKTRDTSLIFGDLNLSNFEYAVDGESEKVVLVDRENDIVINNRVHGQIAATLRKIHHLEKNRQKPGNKEAKEYMIERAKIKAKRRKNIKEDSQLESLIIAMVSTEQFKYNFEEVKKLTIYQFNESVRQIIKKVEYDNRMHGIYSGTINAKDLNKDDLNWLTHK